VLSVLIFCLIEKRITRIKIKIKKDCEENEQLNKNELELKKLIKRINMQGISASQSDILKYGEYMSIMNLKTKNNLSLSFRNRSKSLT
jgi:hypothetical protein